jgi:hypothetical protein
MRYDWDEVLEKQKKGEVIGQAFNPSGYFSDQKTEFF